MEQEDQINRRKRTFVLQVLIQPSFLLTILVMKTLR